MRVVDRPLNWFSFELLRQAQIHNSWTGLPIVTKSYFSCELAAARERAISSCQAKSRSLLISCSCLTSVIELISRLRCSMSNCWPSVRAMGSMVTSTWSTQTIALIFLCRNNGYVLSPMCAVAYLVLTKKQCVSKFIDWFWAGAER